MKVDILFVLSKSPIKSCDLNPKPCFISISIIFLQIYKLFFNLRQGENLTKLPLKFRNVSGHFSCSYNYLKSLEGSPNYVGSYFYCFNNNLTSLEGVPTNVGGYFICSNNNLSSLEGGPIHVGDNFHCDNNNITSLEGFPLHIGGNFICYDNPVYEIWKLFKDVSKIELFNDYDIIRGTDIVLDRLNDFLITIGKDPVKSVDGYNNI